VLWRVAWPSHSATFRLCGAPHNRKGMDSLAALVTQALATIRTRAHPLPKYGFRTCEAAVVRRRHPRARLTGACPRRAAGAYRRREVRVASAVPPSDPDAGRSGRPSRWFDAGALASSRCRRRPMRLPQPSSSHGTPGCLLSEHRRACKPLSSATHNSEYSDRPIRR
jgi:hypothetical protein